MVSVNTYFLVRGSNTTCDLMLSGFCRYRGEVNPDMEKGYDPLSVMG
jgi:hypothetical protein